MPKPTDLRGFATALDVALGRGGWSQRALADALGLSQSTISHWKSATSAPPPATTFALEEALGLAPGTLSRHLGYVPSDHVVAATVEEAIVDDPLLSPHHQRVLQATYRELVTP